MNRSELKLLSIPVFETREFSGFALSSSYKKVTAVYLVFFYLISRKI